MRSFLILHSHANMSVISDCNELETQTMKKKRKKKKHNWG